MRVLFLVKSLRYDFRSFSFISPFYHLPLLFPLVNTASKKARGTSILTFSGLFCSYRFCNTLRTERTDVMYKRATFMYSPPFLQYRKNAILYCFFVFNDGLYKLLKAHY